MSYQVLNDHDDGNDGEAEEDDDLLLLDELNNPAIEDDDDDDDDDDGQATMFRRLPVLGMRGMDNQIASTTTKDKSSGQLFLIHPLVFPNFVSLEAQNLIQRLMEPCVDERIALSDVKEHSWMLKHVV